MKRFIKADRQGGATIRDVARLAGASVASVSAALNGTTSPTIRVSESTRARILEAARELGYVVNPHAKSLATGKTRVIGLMLPYVAAFLDQNPFSVQVLHGVMRAAIERHYNVMLYTATEDQPDHPTMIDTRVDGIALVMPEPGSSIHDQCERLGIPVVSVLAPPAPDRWTVNSDDFEGGRIAAHHLAGLGHTRIAHLAGNPTVMTTAPRAAGFRYGIEEVGLDPDQCPVVPAGFDLISGRVAARRLFAEPDRSRPTAVFAANDLCAQGCMEAAREMGLIVPADVAVVGFDDTPHAAQTQPPLTSVNMRIEQLGAVAAENLFARIDGQEAPRDVVLPVSITIRTSCGARALHNDNVLR